MELGADFFFEKSRDFEKVPEVLEKMISISCNRPNTMQECKA
jgi:hypothetical protein